MELALDLDDERLAVVLFARGPLLPNRLFDWACAAFWNAPQTTIRPRSIDVRIIAIPSCPFPIGIRREVKPASDGAASVRLGLGCILSRIPGA
jgi:hypothetical protein